MVAHCLHLLMIHITMDGNEMSPAGSLEEPVTTHHFTPEQCEQVAGLTSSCIAESTGQYSGPLTWSIESSHAPGILSIVYHNADAACCYSNFIGVDE